MSKRIRTIKPGTFIGVNSRRTTQSNRNHSNCCPWKYIAMMISYILPNQVVRFTPHQHPKSVSLVSTNNLQTSLIHKSLVILNAFSCPTSQHQHQSPVTSTGSAQAPKNSKPQHEQATSKLHLRNSSLLVFGLESF